MSLHSYGSIFNPGHKAIEYLRTVPTFIQEKVDGSQFSFGVPLDGDWAGQLMVRSKGSVMPVEAPEKMFTLAVKTAKELYDAGLLTPGWTYRAEFLQKPKHNALAYDRVPKGNLILFDVDRGGYDMLTPEELKAEGQRIGLEVVPLLHVGAYNMEDLRRLLDTKSVLGDQLIEGVVIKQMPPVVLWNADKKPLMGKFVSEKFREIHRRVWGEENPNQQQVLDRITDAISGPARWQKAVMRLKEAGVYTGTVKDIGPLIKSIQADVEKEGKEEAARMLLEHFWPQIRRASGRGVPQWFKDELLREELNSTPLGTEPVAEPSNSAGDE